MAAKQRELNQRVAATWFIEGKRQLADGGLKKAIESFRKATSLDYENREYQLALANALAAAGHTEEARYALLRLRDAAPENAEVNLDLARLEAKAGDVSEASRYYHNALYGLWTGKQVDQQQRAVRMELIHFLLDHQQRSAALSELLILEAELPDNAAIHTQVGHLFLETDDASQALKHYTHALRLDRHDPAALSGAGEAAFRLGDYEKARRDLQNAMAVGDTEQARQLLAETKMILGNDPLAPRLAPEERSRRLKNDLEQAFKRLEACIAHSHDPGLDTLHAQALAMRPRVKITKLGQPAELLDSGIELIDAIEETSRTKCGEPQGLDQALLLIGRKYKGILQ